MPERAEAITNFVARSLENVGLAVTVEIEPDRAAFARQVGQDKRIGDMALFDSSPQRYDQIPINSSKQQLSFTDILTRSAAHSVS